MLGETLHGGNGVPIELDASFIAPRPWRHAAGEERARRRRRESQIMTNTSAPLVAFVPFALTSQPPSSPPPSPELDPEDPLDPLEPFAPLLFDPDAPLLPSAPLDPLDPPSPLLELASTPLSRPASPPPSPLLELASTPLSRPASPTPPSNGGGEVVGGHSNGYGPATGFMR